MQCSRELPVATTTCRPVICAKEGKHVEKQDCGALLTDTDEEAMDCRLYSGWLVEESVLKSTTVYALLL